MATPRDRLGNRLGTQAAAINEKLTSFPKDAGALADETQLPVGRVRDHLRALLKKGLVIKTENGVRLVSDQ